LFLIYLFINKLDTLLSKLYNPTLEYIIFGDINIDYLVNSDRKKQLETLLQTYNLTSRVYFPTRSQKNSATIIDNIFIDMVRKQDHYIYPKMNALSDHDAQLMHYPTMMLN
jgi:exonuclease III